MALTVLTTWMPIVTDYSFVLQRKWTSLCYLRTPASEGLAVVPRPDSYSEKSFVLVGRQHIIWSIWRLENSFLQAETRLSCIQLCPIRISVGTPTALRIFIVNLCPSWRARAANCHVIRRQIKYSSVSWRDVGNQENTQFYPIWWWRTEPAATSSGDDGLYIRRGVILYRPLRVFWRLVIKTSQVGKQRLVVTSVILTKVS
jgi:hypothetical protein